MTNDKLPPLPELECLGGDAHTSYYGHTDETLRAYGLACIAALTPSAPVAVGLTDEQLGRIAYKGFDDFWSEDCSGKDEDAWIASAKAVRAALNATPPAKPQAPEAEVVGPNPFAPGRFKAWKQDINDLHSPWFLVMPGGDSIPFNHNADDAVDCARAMWVAAACNLAAHPAAVEVPAPAQGAGGEVDALVTTIRVRAIDWYHAIADGSALADTYWREFTEAVSELASRSVAEKKRADDRVETLVAVGRFLDIDPDGEMASPEYNPDEPASLGIIRAIKRYALATATQARPSAEAEPIGWLYDWTHSSATGKPDEHCTGFTEDEAYAKRHRNARPVYAAPSAGHGEGMCLPYGPDTE